MFTKQCIQCSKTFRSAERDQTFYRTRGMPPPTLCPDCRRQRRLSWRNERSLYARQCDKCQKSIISVYSTDKPFPVYCETCWYGDSWAATDYGREFDFSRPFFEQFRELIDATPRLYMQSKECDNSEYCNYSYKNKNCYLVFGSHYEENCLYGQYSSKNKDCLDYYGCYQSELCYESIQSNNCYACAFIDHCEYCADTYFSIDLKGCKNCLFSAHLRNKQYYIFNQPHTKEEYAKKLADLKLHTRTGLQAALKIFNNEVRKKYPVRYAYITNSENCEGDNHVHSKDLVYCFNGTNSEHCTYGYKFDATNDAMDVDCMGYDRSELLYEIIGGSGDFSCSFLDSCWHCSEVMYSNLCFSSKNSFGCVGLVQKQYCILNTQYDPATYQALCTKIIAHIQATGEYGEFFPTHISPYGYNETVAQLNYPLKQAEVLNRGWSWKSDELVTSLPQSVSLPNDINDVPITFAQTVLQCDSCTKNYRITQAEITLLKQIQLPLANTCPQCRYIQRFHTINPNKLWQRQCMCTQTDHAHKGRCPTEFSTTYAPERIQLVYCAGCYKKMVY